MKNFKMLSKKFLFAVLGVQVAFTVACYDSKEECEAVNGTDNYDYVCGETECEWKEKKPRQKIKCTCACQFQRYTLIGAPTNALDVPEGEVWCTGSDRDKKSTYFVTGEITTTETRKSCDDVSAQGYKPICKGQTQALGDQPSQSINVYDTPTAVGCLPDDNTPDLLAVCDNNIPLPVP